ncbi:transporter [Brevundimonas sp.]|uniref:ATP-grasp domain-containing protein n=1 Tax=Brevundimonas sp. TaxID=1871086 RepID=UPI0025E5F6AF|nr:transporter [Brevundimonas sp.]
MPKLCILTPDPDDESFQGRWREVFGRMADPLSGAGAELEGRAWTDPGDLSGFDLVLPLMTWGYHRDHARWLEATHAWEAAGLPVMNPPSVLRWNSDKSYLQRLGEAGAPAVPTLHVDGVDAVALDQARARFGVGSLVVKPAVSASAYRTLRLGPGDPLDGAPDGAAMVQPYLPAIETDGETSLIFLGGRFSHAIRKVAKPGDFRVQPEWGGLISAVEPSAAEHDAAAAILKAVEEPLLYARIDLVPGLDGRPLMMEAELIEPDLYLGYDEGAPRRFAQAVLGGI